MRKLIEEFKKFAVRGNVIDLAVAVVIGTAFGKIVSSLVDNIVMPFVGILIGGINLSKLSFTVSDADIAYGVFLQNVIDFLIITCAIFIAIKTINKVQERVGLESGSKSTQKLSEEVKLLQEIRDILKTK